MNNGPTQNRTMPQNISELPYSNVNDRQLPDYTNIQFEKPSFTTKKQSMGYPITQGSLNPNTDKRSSSALANMQQDKDM
jgi:hypothetical protein